MIRIDQAGRRVFCCSFDSSGIIIRASRVRELPSGDFRALLQIGDGDVLLHSSMVNLCTASGREAVIRALNGTRDDWKPVVNDACSAIISRLQRGNRSVLVKSEDPAPLDQHLLDPILPKGQTTLLFGKGGSTKSYLALTAAVVVGLPVEDNPFGWRTLKTHTPGLYLDNEADEGTFRRRLKAVVNGLNVPPAHIRYRRLVGALANEVEAIQEEILEHGIGFVILDSGGKAVSGNPSDPGLVNELFSCLDELSTTSLVITHEPKTTEANARDKTPFGSQYWESNARRCWRIERAPGGTEEDFTVCLACTKSNDSTLYRPAGYRVQFTGRGVDQAVSYAPVDLKTTEFAGKVPLRERINGLLKHGPLDVPEIAAELDTSPDMVRARLNERKEDYVRVGNKWGLGYEQ